MNTYQKTSANLLRVTLIGNSNYLRLYLYYTNRAEI